MTLNTSIIRQTLRNVKFGIRKKYIATLLSLSLQSLYLQHGIHAIFIQENYSKDYNYLNTITVHLGM